MNPFQKIQKLKQARGIKEFILYKNKLMDILRDTRINKQMDKIGHTIQENFWEIHQAQMESLFWRKWRKRIGLFSTCVFLGFFICDGSQLTRHRWWTQPDNVDYIAEFVIPANNIRQRFPQAFDRILADGLSKEGMDTLEWIAMGQRFAEVGVAEYAFHCYYMAHLLNHKYIKTNSDLQFDTALPPNTGAGREGASLDEILDNLLSDE